MNGMGRWMASAAIAVTLLLSATGAPVYATYKVDCDAVMNEFRQRKEPNQIASDLNINERSVHRCIRAGARAQRRARSTALPAKSK